LGNFEVLAGGEGCQVAVDYDCHDRILRDFSRASLPWGSWLVDGFRFP
jgi:hypothetical protein